MDDYDPLEIEEARQTIRDDLKLLRIYRKRCVAIRAIAERLVEPLEAPGLRKVVQKIDRRIEDVAELEAMVQESETLIGAFMKEFERIVTRLGRGAVPDAAYASDELLMSPARDALAQHAQSLQQLAQQMQDEDEEAGIDWMLDDYVGSETGVATKLERMTPEGLVDVIAGATGLGVIRWYLNPELIEEAAIEI